MPDAQTCRMAGGRWLVVRASRGFSKFVSDVNVVVLYYLSCSIPVIQHIPTYSCTTTICQICSLQAVVGPLPHLGAFVQLAMASVTDPTDPTDPEKSDTGCNVCNGCTNGCTEAAATCYSMLLLSYCNVFNI